MFGKVLLLALVCVAATEVRGNDSECKIEEAFRQAEIISDQVGEIIRYVLDIYMNGYLTFDRTAMEYWGIIWDYANGELKELENASAELTKIAKEQNSPEEVFTCISQKTQKTNEVIRVMPWAFDYRLQTEIKKYFNERTEMATPAQNNLGTYLQYYKNTIVEGLKKCETDECLEEILSNYQADYSRLCEEYGETIKKMDAQSEKFKVMAESRLAASKGTFTYARVAGVNEIKNCLVA